MNGKPERKTTTGGSSCGGTHEHHPAVTVRGMSRAAQRRRKKKRKLNNGEELYEEYNSKETVELTSVKETSEHRLMARTPAVINTPPSSHRNIYDHQIRPILDSMMGEEREERCSNLQRYRHEYESFFCTISSPLPLSFRLRRSLDDAAVQQANKALQQSSADCTAHIQPSKFDPNIYQACHGLDKASLSAVCPQLKAHLQEHSQDGTIACSVLPRTEWSAIPPAA